MNTRQLKPNPARSMVSGRVRAMARRLLLGPPTTDNTARLIAEGRLTIGRHSYDPPSVIDYSNEDFTIAIGSFCSIGTGVVFIPGARHHLDRVSTFPFRERLGFDAPDDHPPARNIRVGHDVWIGLEARVLGGVTIGNGAVIGAYSVVARDVAPYEIVAGAPVKHLRWRVSPDVATKLEKIAWWDWPDDEIRRRVFEMEDVERFVASHARE